MGSPTGDKPTLAYALPPRLPRLQVALRWCARHRRFLIASTSLAAALQLSWTLPVVQRTVPETCRYCGARRVVDERTFAGVTYFRRRSAETTFSNPPPVFLDSAHAAHDWRRGSFIERHGNVWRLKGDVVSGLFDADYELTQAGILMMATFPPAPVDVLRDVYADVARCRDLYEMQQAFGQARARYVAAQRKATTLPSAK